MTNQATTAPAAERDYLAIIMMPMGGSSYARGPDRQDCIDRVGKIAVSDWSSLFDCGGKPCKVNVFDVTGHDKVWWDAQGVHVNDPDVVLPVELVDVTLPKARKRR
jgi:hypothetical protein